MDYFGHIESVSSNLEGYTPSNYSQEVFYPNGISNYKVSSYKQVKNCPTPLYKTLYNGGLNKWLTK